MAEPREHIPADEAERFARYAAEITALQKERAGRKGTAAVRALHVKPHVGAVGALQVHGNLSPALAQGVFAGETTWPLYARASNGGPSSMHDSVNEVRALSLKLVGVPGKKLIKGMEDAVTQDLLFIQTPETAVRSPEEFMAIIRNARKGPRGILLGLLREAGPLRTLAILKKASGMPKVKSLATATLYTAAPILMGSGAAKLSLLPDAHDAPRGHGTNALRDDMVVRLKDGPVRFTLRAQLFVDEQRTPIEDGDRVWDERVSPWHAIGTVTLSKQDVTSVRGQEIERLVESVSFDPWHAIAAHRPLGAIMRARAPTYKASVIGRAGGDEPTSVLSAG